ncbi:MAG: hypothetical protein JNM84_19170 [Planctomycetes bacterium]|nr:hypothetical protein [Planctomycetota bacterium]
MPTQRTPPPAPTASTTEKTARRTGKSSPERIYNLLMKARTANEVTLHFENNRVVSGALIFNEFKGTGRIINVDLEISVDFAVDDLRDVRL